MWRLSYTELTGKIQRKYGEMDARLLSQHNSLVEVVSAALGKGKGGSSADDAVDVTKGAQTVEQAVAAMNAMLSVG